MGISCQRNGHYSTARGTGQRPLICQSSAAGRCAGRRFVLIMQLAYYADVYVAETLKDRKQELGILNPKKAYNICEYTRYTYAHTQKHI